MKTHIVADGEKRLKGSSEFNAKLRVLRQDIRARHESELAIAGFFRRCIIRWRMALEYRRERRNMVPSSRSLYSSSIVTGSMHKVHSTHCTQQG
jgi:hypothetical protein